MFIVLALEFLEENIAHRFAIKSKFVCFDAIEFPTLGLIWAIILHIICYLIFSPHQQFPCSSHFIRESSNDVCRLRLTCAFYDTIEQLIFYYRTVSNWLGRRKLHIKCGPSPCKRIGPAIFILHKRTTPNILSFEIKKGKQRQNCRPQSDEWLHNAHFAYDERDYDFAQIADSRNEIGMT